MNYFWIANFITFFLTVFICLQNTYAEIVAVIKGRYDCTYSCNETIKYTVKICKNNCNKIQKRVGKKTTTSNDNSIYLLYLSFSIINGNSISLQQQCIVPEDNCLNKRGSFRNKNGLGHYSEFNLSLPQMNVKKLLLK
uniref:Transmembrane protein n=1 Tax=Strongyloides venezuelensis TaxID=75913 RepID=A0A0K0FQW9_STRVS